MFVKELKYEGCYEYITTIFHRDAIRMNKIVNTFSIYVYRPH